jgi:phage shock protein PspC (stress-responsive transcriptional regulator)
MKRLYRSESDRMIAGVASGLGAYLGIDATVIRLAFVLLSFLGGSGILAYLVMWVIVPAESRLDTPSGDVPGQNLAEVQEGLRRGARHAQDALDRVRGRRGDQDQAGGTPSTRQQPIEAPDSGEQPPGKEPPGT